MSDGNVYEAAAEVVDAIRSLHEDLVQSCYPTLNDPALRIRRRDRWAGELFAALVSHEKHRGVPNFLIHASDIQILVRHAWQLADALEAADPQGKSKPSPAEIGADSAETPGLAERAIESED